MLYAFQCLTTAQIAMLLDFETKLCQRRLRRLFSAGYLDRASIPSINIGRSPNLFFLGNQASLLLDVPISRPRLNNGNLSHQQKNSDLMIQIFLACKSANIQIELLPEHSIRTAGKSEIIPDGAFMLKKGDKQAVFILENCAGTEIVKSPTYNQDIETKIVKYVELFKNNEIQFYENYFDCKFNRFRLLFIANSPQRLSAISKVVKVHDSYGFINLATISEFNQKGVLANIWNVANNQANVSIV